MSTTSAVSVETKASWLPLIVVVLTQIQASFAVNALTVSMAGITTDLDTPATNVGTAITASTFAMAAFILLGAKLGAKFGTRRVFQIAVVAHGLAMAGVMLAQSAGMLFVAQAASGVMISLISPALTVFIATNFKGKQQAQAIGFLAAAIPAAGVLALLIAGTFATTIGWRYSFALIVLLAAVNLLLSFRIPKVPAMSEVAIDWTGAIIAAVSIILLSFGFSGLAPWGVLFATDSAPFDILGLSPAPLLVILGLVGAQVFFAWARKRKAEGKPPIFDLAVLKSASERATTMCMAIMLFIGTAANFLIPLYIQIVQGRSGIETSFSLIPYTLSIFVASSAVAGLYTRFAPRHLARAGFVVVAAALTLIAFTIRNDWSQALIVTGLILLGLGQGAIVALVFNTLLSANPKELAGDVGAWRGLVHNLSGSVGIAVATVFAVSVLSGILQTQALEHPEIPTSLVEQVNFDNSNFLTNDQLESALQGSTDATPEQLEAAITINEEARLVALKVSLLGLAALALLAIVPAGRMPGFTPGDIPARLSTGEGSDEPDDIDEPKK